MYQIQVMAAIYVNFHAGFGSWEFLFQTLLINDKSSLSLEPGSKGFPVPVLDFDYALACLKGPFLLIAE